MILRIIAVFSLLVYGPSAYAIYFSYSAGARLATYENINQLPEVSDGEVSKGVVAGLTMEEDNADLNMDINFEVETVEYQNNQVDDEVTGTADMSILWIVDPAHLEWEMRYVLTQVSIDPYEGNNPNNRQNANAFEAGPNAIWTFSKRNSLSISPRFERYTFGESVQDNARVTNSLSWLYDINSSKTVSLNQNYEMVKYDQDEGNDYDRNDVYFNYLYHPRENTYELEYGLIAVDGDQVGEISTSRYRFAIQNERTTTSNIRLEYEKNLLDTGTAILDYERVIADSLETSSSDLYVDKTLRIRYTKELRSANWGITWYQRKSEYEKLDLLSETEKGYVFNYGWIVSSHLNINLDATTRNTVYNSITPQREDDYTDLSLLFIYRQRANLVYRMRMRTLQNNSTLTEREYEDTQYIFSIAYETR